MNENSYKILQYMIPFPCKKCLLSVFSSKTFFQQYIYLTELKVCFTDCYRLLVSPDQRKRRENVLGRKCQSGTAHMKTDHILFQILLQPSEIWLQPPKNSKAAFMKKRNHHILFKSIHLFSIFIWVELPATFNIKGFTQK